MDSAENPTTLILEAYISMKKVENRKRASHCFLKWLQLSIHVKKVGVNIWPGRPYITGIATLTKSRSLSCQSTYFNPKCITIIGFISFVFVEVQIIIEVVFFVLSGSVTHALRCNFLNRR